MDKLISPPDFFEILCSSTPVVVFDVRSKDEFLKERIWSSVHLDFQLFPSLSAILSEIYRLGDSSKSITPISHKSLLLNRDLYDIVIVAGEGLDKTPIINQFKHKKTTRLLVGGYQLFNTLYPSLCVGSPAQDDYLINKCEKELLKGAPVEVLPQVFYGDESSARNFRALDIIGIGHIVNVAAMLPNYAPTAYVYKRCDLDELPFGNLSALLDDVVGFIVKAKKSGSKTLVYSNSNSDGRAGMIICAYLIKTSQCSLEDAFVAFKKKDRSFSPNVAILARLGEYETHLFGATFLRPSADSTTSTSNATNQLLSDELKYIRRQQLHQLEEDDIAAKEDNLL